MFHLLDGYYTPFGRGAPTSNMSLTSALRDYFNNAELMLPVAVIIRFFIAGDTLI
jgi:hypothetical protein